MADTDTYNTVGPFDASSDELIDALDEADARADRIETAREEAKLTPGFFVIPDYMID